MPTSTINQSFAECNASLYNSGCTVQCISVRWIPNPGSSYSCTPDTKMSVRRHTKKIPFFSKKNLDFFFFRWKKKGKKCYPLSLPILGGRDSTRALQSSPFQNPGGVVRAWRRTNEQRRRKSSCLILDWPSIGWFTGHI